MKLYSPPKRRSANFNSIFYGVTGSGKTQLLGTARLCDATKPIIILDINGGMLTLADLPGIKVVRPVGFAELQEVYEYLRYDNTTFRSCGLDTLTDEQRDISLGTLLGDVDEEMSYTDLGSDKVADRQDWLRSAHQMRKLIRAFRDLSYLPDRSRRLHVFMTAHEKVDESSGFGVPAISGVVGVEAGGYVDVLGRMVRRKRAVDGKTVVARYLHTEEHTGKNGASYLGKNRLGLLGKGVWDPTIPKLIELWTGNNEENGNA